MTLNFVVQISINLTGLGIKIAKTVFLVNSRVKKVTVTVVQLRYLAKLVRGIFMQF